MESNPTPVVLKKGELVSFEEFNQGKTASKSGWSTITAGSELHEFEWSSKVVQNSIAAIQRQLSGRCQPSKHHLKKFDAMCARMFNYFFQQFDKLDHSDLDSFSLFDYANRTDWSKNKCHMYQKNILD